MSWGKGDTTLYIDKAYSQWMRQSWLYEQRKNGDEEIDKGVGK